MALPGYARFYTGDLRRWARELGTTSLELRPQVRRIVQHETNVEAQRLRAAVGSGATTDSTLWRRSGNLSAAVRGDVIDHGFSFTASLSFTSSSQKVLAAAGTQTGGAELRGEGESEAPSTTIRPRQADQLAFPPRNAPRDIISAAGVQLMTAREASKHYFLIFRPTVILGVPRRQGAAHAGHGQRGVIDATSPRKRERFRERKPSKRRPLLLFIRRPQVTVPTRIRMSEYLHRIETRVIERVNTLFATV